MNKIATTSTSISAKKFETITLVDNQLLLVNKKNEPTTVLFSEIEKVYIKKNKINILNKILIVSLIFMLQIIVALLSSLESVMFLTILYIPIIVKIQNYKWYGLYIKQNYNQLHFKMFYLSNKQEYINLVNAIKKEMYYHQIKTPIQFKVVEENNSKVKDYSFPSLSIA